MTIASEANRSGPYACNGATKRFPYAFKIYDAAHIRVILTSAEGMETTLALGTDYTVAGVGEDGGGAVDTALAYPAGCLVTLILNVPFTQEIDLENQGAYFAETIERAIDQQTQMSLQLKEQVARAVILPVTSSVSVDELTSSVLSLADIQPQMSALAPIAQDIETVAGISGVVVAAEGHANTAVAAAAQATGKAAEAAASAAAAATWDPANYSTTAQIQAAYLRYDTPQGLSAAQKQGLWAATGSMPRLSSGAALPNTDIGPIWHDDYADILLWRTIGGYTGYASINLGKVGHVAGSIVPPGCLERNGAAISRAAYSALFAYLGTTFGAGDGATTFNLPDDRGLFDRGWDHGRGLDFGRVIGTYQADQNKAHTHQVSTRSQSFAAAAGSYMTDVWNSVQVLPTATDGGSEVTVKNRASLAIMHF
ncbi:Microcystin-dependent protein [Pleomorphomonas diazotrophica]|nr:Microcystin-dependent protein [Pleomorphomonas diazotrophica]